MSERRKPREKPPQDAAMWFEALKSEMPKEAAGASLAPMNLLERFLLPDDAVAVTWPWGRIAYDQAGIEASGERMDDILAHELTHVGQNQREGLLRSFLGPLFESRDYLDRPHELEAFRTEGRRKARRRDIQLK